MTVTSEGTHTFTPLPPHTDTFEVSERGDILDTITRKLRDELTRRRI